MKQRAIQFTKYINKVFRFNQFLKSLSDGRINPSVNMQDMLAVIFLGIITRKGSFNQIEESQKQGYFNKALNKKLLRGSAETYGNILKTSEVGEYIEYNNEIIRKARYNKALKGGTIDGFTVVALDGTELTRTESEHRSCSCCKSTECLRVEETRIDRLGNALNGSQVTYIITTASKKEMPAETVWRILHRRWDIENKTFF